MKNKIAIVLIVIVINGIETIENEYTNQNLMNKTFQVLLWTDIWGIKEWNNEKFKNLNCEHSNCNITTNRTYLNTSDAVVFHWIDVNGSDLPISQYPNQKWVLMNLEAPPLTSRNNAEKLMLNLNWTLTYRKDSDLYKPYGNVVECKREWKPNYDFKQKNRSIAWVVSNCITSSKREEYVRDLEKHIDVDIYGKCGNYSCNRNDGQCFDSIEKKYKFYLSFENAKCKDYVTEKLFRTIEYNIIPIVMGSANYSSIMPYNSYIDVSNFSSPLHLVNYLKEIINDENRYKSYFEWKNNHCVKFPNEFCTLCEGLNMKLNNTVNRNWESNLIKWYFESPNCESNL